jgi:WD40 repeat protein
VIGDESVNGIIEVYDGKSNFALIKSFQAHTQAVLRIKQWPNSSLVITGSVDSKVKIWDPTNNLWNLVLTYTDHAAWILALEYINADTIASSSNDHTIKIWSISTGATIKTINTPYEIWSLKLLSNGFHLAGGQAGNGYGFGYIEIYDINTGSLYTTLYGHTWYVNDLVLISNHNGNGDLLISSCGDYSIKIWNLSTYTCEYTLNGHTNEVFGLKQISTDILASVSVDTTVKLWNITTGQIIRTMTGHSNSIIWSIDSLSDYYQNSIVSGSFDRTIKIWNFKTGAIVKSITSNIQIRSLASILISTTTTTTTATTQGLYCFHFVFS